MYKLFHYGLAVALAIGAHSALAGHITISAKFDGSETSTTPFPGSCGTPDAALGYQQLGPIQVSATGVYDIADASYQGTGSESDEFGVDVVIRVYDGSFDPQNINANIVGTSVDIQEKFTLEENNSYVVVVQHWCENQAGTFGIAFSGEGDITGNGIVQSPEYWKGVFQPDDPTADFGFGDVVYNLNGPVRFDESGVYYYADLGWQRRTDVVLYIYNGPFNPDDPGENAVAVLDDGSAVTLQSNQDYYLLTYPWDSGSAVDEWHYAIFPPGEPAINMFFEDAWSDATIEYQGVLLTVLPSYNFVFAAWFTYDEAPSTKQSAGTAPLPGLQSVGDPSQRWITAGGVYTEGATEVPLKFENSYGGGFNASVPAPSQDPEYGTGRMVIESCNDITIEYDLPTGPGEGAYSVSRSAPDPLKVELCEALGLQPGVIE
jgi:hypothetical protein